MTNSLHYANNIHTYDEGATRVGIRGRANFATYGTLLLMTTHLAHTETLVDEEQN